MTVVLDARNRPRHPEKAHRPDAPVLTKPDWIRVKAPVSKGYAETHTIVRANGLHTVCEEAGCPNIGECWDKKHATFMLMGDICTRACAFCNVKTGLPGPLDGAFESAFRQDADEVPAIVGIAAHVAFAEPVSTGLRNLLADSARSLGVTVHNGGTYVNMDGPAFSTRAESEFNHRNGFDVIAMTNLPEAKLAREAEIAFATMAMITDYDCWKVEEEPVSVQTVIGHLLANSETAKKVLARLIPEIPREANWPEHRALETAIRLFGRLVSPAELAARATEIAVELRHPIYDCFYLALAERERAPLISADQRLIAAGKRMKGVEVRAL